MTDETQVNDVENSDAGTATSSGVPLRGLAMVLIAVAVLFGLWALYSFTQGDDQQTASDETTTEVVEETVVNEETVVVEEEPASPESGDASASEADSAPENPENGTGSPQVEAPAPPAPAGGEPAGAVAPEDVRVNVLNNSTVSGLAEDTFNHLRDSGWEVGQHGNLPEQTGAVVPVTTVYFAPGDTSGEEAANNLATELADTYGIPVEVEPNIPAIPDEQSTPGQITLVLMGSLTS